MSGLILIFLSFLLFKFEICDLNNMKLSREIYFIITWEYGILVMLYFPEPKL